MILRKKYLSFVKKSEAYGSFNLIGKKIIFPLKCKKHELRTLREIGTPRSYKWNLAKFTDIKTQLYFYPGPSYSSKAWIRICSIRFLVFSTYKLSNGFQTNNSLEGLHVCIQKKSY